MKIKKMARIGGKLRIFSKQYHEEWRKVFVLENQSRYLHIKTNKIYYVFGEVINSTNGDLDGQELILYTDGEKVYVRDVKEFYEKFQHVED